MDVVKAIRRGTSGAILARPGLFVTVAGATVVLSIMLLSFAKIPSGGQ
jgi:hypothetical protein